MVKVKVHVWHGGRMWESELHVDGVVIIAPSIFIEGSHFSSGKWDDFVTGLTEPLPYDLVDRINWAFDVQLGGPRARGRVSVPLGTVDGLGYFYPWTKPEDPVALTKPV